MKGRPFVRILAACLIGVLAVATSRTPGLVSAEDASQFFEIRDGTKVAFCGLFTAGWQPAVRKSATRYVSIRNETRALDKRIKTERNSLTRSKLTKRRTTLNGTFSRTRKTCASGPTSEPPTPLPGQPTSTPAPTATPAQQICFLPGGDVRPGCFGIPTNLTGNINRGDTYYKRNCAGCHTNRSMLPWSRVQSAFSRIPQMQPFRPTDPDLADVVAYLNRFNF